jgi:hypothetical protein
MISKTIFFNYLSANSSTVIAILTSFILLLGVLQLQAKDSDHSTRLMNPEKLHKVIQQYADDVTVNNNVISFTHQSVNVYCIWDANADRMRMVAPIAEASKLTNELILLALKANYHTALDARYAIGDEILYSTYIHPLSPLTTAEVESAIRQVSTAALTFGSSFSSGELVFPEKTDGENSQPKSL